MVQAASDRLKEEASRQPHLSWSVLWNYAHSQADLDLDQFNHLGNCEDCMDVLALCRVQESLAAVQRRLKDIGLREDTH